CDVLVIGSGASGLSAAVTAALHGMQVVVAEKESMFGGTTARSGGWLWVPRTSLAKSWGIDEDPELAKLYLRHETGNKYDSERIDAHFIDRAKPGVIAVTRNGRRFTNEANSYHDFVQAMFEACRGEAEICAYLVCDHRALRKYGLGCVAPFPFPIGRHLRAGY